MKEWDSEMGVKTEDQFCSPGEGCMSRRQFHTHAALEALSNWREWTIDSSRLMEGLYQSLPSSFAPSAKVNWGRNRAKMTKKKRSLPGALAVH